MISSEDSAAILVARFLRSNNYTETLEAFLSEAGLPPDAGNSVNKGALTIEQILQEKRVFDVTLAFEKTGIDDEAKGWKVPAPSTPSIVDTLSSSSNILHVSVEKLEQHESDAATQVMVVADASRSLSFLETRTPFASIPMSIDASDSPLLSCAMLSQRYLVSSSMSGKTFLHDVCLGVTVDERRDHQKYVVRAVCCEDDSGSWVATAAWDAKVYVYRLRHSGERDCKLGEPLAVAKLPSNPESILFISHPEISTPVLLVSRRDSTFIYYYAIPDHIDSFSDEGPTALIYLGRQNLAPHSNAWVAFTPSAMAVSPRDPSLLAVATSAVPHMKLIIVRMMLPPPLLNGAAPASFTGGATQSVSKSDCFDPAIAVISRDEPAIEPSSHHYADDEFQSQARAELALQDREAAAILIHCTTFAPQTPYSTPALAWRPDATGVFVNGDDGAVRGIEAHTGKVIAVLKNGHEPGSKIRCLWAGWADDEQKNEIVISGGFDRRLIVWSVEES